MAAARPGCLDGEAAATLLRLCSASSSESSSESESSADPVVPKRGLVD